MNFNTAIASLTSIFVLETAYLQTLTAQTENDPIIEQIIESVAENTTEDFDYTELTERLNFYRKSPIDLNRVTGEQLKELVFLSPVQISNLIGHIRDNGPFLDPLELQSVAGFSTDMVKKLLPFVTVNSNIALTNISAGNLLSKGTSDLMIRYGQILEKQRGFISDTTGSRYLGTPQRLLLRYRYNYGTKLSASLTMEKDAGEAFFSGAQTKGFDFISGNIFLKNAGKFSKILVGDYALQFGQGLTLWTGLSFGKGAAIATLSKQNNGLRPYSSANEYLFFRGLAATLNVNKISFTPFVSYRKLDAGSKNSTNPDEKEVTSLNQTGFHRTPAETANQNFLSQLVYGLNVQYASTRLHLGALVYQTNFGNTFEKETEQYKKFEFAGKSLTNTGIYYDYNWRNIYFFGEASHSLLSGYAFLNGAIASLSPTISLVVLQRLYQRDYQSFYSQAISESSKNVNESGFYGGLTLNPNRTLELSVYADAFHFPWLKFRVDAPSRGHELFSQFSFTLKNKLKIAFRYRFKLKQENDDTDNPINILQQIEKNNYRAELNYNINNDFLLRSRLEMVRYQRQSQMTETGHMMFQDLIYNPKVSRFSGSMRFAIFDVPSFNSSIYTYENDVLYSYSVPGFQNRGMRFYFSGRYGISRATDLWLRYAITKYTNIDEIGSGLDEIKGSRKSDIKVQLRFRF